MSTERLALGHVVSSASVFGKTARFFVDFLILKFFKKGHPFSCNSGATLAHRAPKIAANSKAYPVLYKKTIKNPGSKRLTKITLFYYTDFSTSVNSQFSKFHITRQSSFTSVQSQSLRKSTSLKSKFPKFHLSEITVSKIPPQ